MDHLRASFPVRASLEVFASDVSQLVKEAFLVCRDIAERD